MGLASACSSKLQLSGWLAAGWPPLCLGAVASVDNWQPVTSQLFASAADLHLTCIHCVLTSILAPPVLNHHGCSMHSLHLCVCQIAPSHLLCVLTLTLVLPGIHTAACTQYTSVCHISPSHDLGDMMVVLNRSWTAALCPTSPSVPWWLMHCAPSLTRCWTSTW